MMILVAYLGATGFFIRGSSFSFSPKQFLGAQRSITLLKLGTPKQAWCTSIVARIARPSYARQGCIWLETGHSE